MKRIFITATFLMGWLYPYAQETSQVIPISEDSLKVLYAQIDELGESDLTRVQEHLRYRTRIEPSEQNSKLLLYVDERLKLVRQ